MAEAPAPLGGTYPGHFHTKIVWIKIANMYWTSTVMGAVLDIFLYYLFQYSQLYDRINVFRATNNSKERTPILAWVWNPLSFHWSLMFPFRGVTEALRMTWHRKQWEEERTKSQGDSLDKYKASRDEGKTRKRWGYQANWQFLSTRNKENRTRRWPCEWTSRL